MSYKEEFKKSYEAGRLNTRNEVENLRQGELSHDFARTLAKPVVYLSILLTIIAFFYCWLKFGFLLAVVIGIGAWFVSFFVLGIFMLLIASLLRLGKKK